MSLFRLVVRSALRNRFRTALTVGGTAMAVLAFLFVRTVVTVWYSGVESAADDRLVTRNRISAAMTMPQAYYQRVLDQVPGLEALSYTTWFAGIYPKDERGFFQSFAIEAQTYLDVYKDVTVPPAQLAAWLADPAGAVVGDVLAAKYGWKVDDQVTLRGTLYPGDWRFTIRGVYDVTNKQLDRNTLLFHWKYLDEGLPEEQKGNIGWLLGRVKDPRHSAEVSQAIDRLFESSDAATLTESERAFNLSFLEMYSAMIGAIELVSIVILLILTMIVGNTIAMGVRERTHEYGALRAIGFLPRHLAALVVGETLLVTLLGSAAGIALCVPVIDGFGTYIVENMGSFFQYFAVEGSNVALAAIMALLVGLVSAALPVIGVMRLEVTSALRRVG